MTAAILTNSLRLAKTVLVIGLAALAATQTRAESLTLHVAPGGNDSWSGRLAEPNPAGTDGPLASIDRAQRAIRDLRKEGKVPGPVTVLIRGSPSAGIADRLYAGRFRDQRRPGHLCRICGRKAGALRRPADYRLAPRPRRNLDGRGA